MSLIDVNGLLWLGTYDSVRVLSREGEVSFVFVSFVIEIIYFFDLKTSCWQHMDYQKMQIVLCACLHCRIVRIAT